MSTNKCNEEAVDTFRIKDNILIGPKVSRTSNEGHFGRYLLEKLTANQDAIGQMDLITGEEMTFAEMKEKSIKCALWLKKQGIKPGDVIAVCSNNQMDAFVPCLSPLYIGAISNQWDHEMDIPTGRHFLKLSEAKVIFVIEEAVEKVLEIAKLENYKGCVVVFGEHPNAVSLSTIMQGYDKSEINDFQCTEIDTKSTATIHFSSGTTGLPKGVELSHHTWLEQFDIDNVLSLKNFKPIWFSNLYWISGVLLMFQGIVSGTTRLIYPKFDEEETCKIVEKYKVTWLFLSTSMGNRLVKSGYLKKYDVSSVNNIIIGGAALQAESHAQLKKYFSNAAVLQVYGMTELCGTVTNQKAQHKLGSCGVAAANVQLKVVDPNTGKALGPNKTGELCIKSTKMFNGYYKNPKATEEIFDNEGWLHTGDLVYYDTDGEVFVVDRMKELIKFRGYHVAPSEIENLLQTHPSIVEVAVVSVPHHTDDEHPIAFAVKVPGAKVTEEELIKLVADTLMDYYKLRAGIIFLDKLPHTPSAKISRKELKAMAKRIINN